MYCQRYGVNETINDSTTESIGQEQPRCNGREGTDALRACAGEFAVFAGAGIEWAVNAEDPVSYGTPGLARKSHYALCPLFKEALP